MRSEPVRVERVEGGIVERVKEVPVEVIKEVPVEVIKYVDREVRARPPAPLLRTLPRRVPRAALHTHARRKMG